MHQLFNSKAVQKPLLIAISNYSEYMVSVYMYACMQIICRLFLNCLLPPSVHALSRARSTAMDAPMTHYSKLSGAMPIAGAVSKYHAEVNQVTATAFRKQIK